MSTENSVIFKGKKDGIVVLLDAQLDFKELCEVLKLKVKDAKKFFGNAKTSIVFSGRSLSGDEEAALLQIISDESSLHISFTENEAFLQHNKIDPAKAADMENQINAMNNYTIFHKGAVRSGQVVKYSGSIVIVGDVNPGAEVMAEGNIVVLGALKGLVHAGCSGNADCFISALSLKPTQIRIADVLTYIPREMNKKEKSQEKMSPVYAYIKEGQIYVAPL